MFSLYSSAVLLSRHFIFQKFYRQPNIFWGGPAQINGNEASIYIKLLVSYSVCQFCHILFITPLEYSNNIKSPFLQCDWSGGVQTGPIPIPTYSNYFLEGGRAQTV